MNTTKTESRFVPMFHLELVREQASFPYTKIDKVEAAAEVFHQLLDKSPVEKMAVIYVNAGGAMIGAELIAIGNMMSVGADMSDIFKGAIKVNAAGIWLAHNHPNATHKESAMASVPDYLFTTKVLESSEILGIQVFDHLIIQPGSHYSIRENAKYMESKARSFLEQRRQTDPLLQLLGGLAADDQAVERLLNEKPWDRGINPTWDISNVCNCPSCARRGSKQH